MSHGETVFGSWDLPDLLDSQHALLLLFLASASSLSKACPAFKPALYHLIDAGTLLIDRAGQAIAWYAMRRVNIFCLWYSRAMSLDERLHICWQKVFGR